MLYRNTSGAPIPTTALILNREAGARRSPRSRRQPNEVVALCMAPDLATLRLFRAVSTPDVSGLALERDPGAVARRSGIQRRPRGAGTLPTGEAVFVASPGVASGTQRTYAVTVAPGGLVTVSQLTGTSGAVTGARLGPLRAGKWDLWRSPPAARSARSSPARPRDSYSAGTASAAPGLPAAILPMTTAAKGDVLFATPDAFVPLVGDGAGGLR